MFFMRRMDKAEICFHHLPFNAVIRLCCYINHVIENSLGENTGNCKGLYKSIKHFNLYEQEIISYFCVK